MTAQVDDVFRYRGTEYELAGISEGELFDPATFGLRPAMASTACWRGYEAVYAISDSHLVLDALAVNHVEDGEGLRPQEGPVINGVRPSVSLRKHSFFSNYYEGLNLRLAYTGGLLLAEGFIPELYVHMGFHPAWKYEEVIELVFEDGLLTGEFDRSEKMAQIRQLILASRDDLELERMPTDDEIRRYVEGAFDRSYRM